MEIVRLLDSRLSVRMQVASPFFVSEFAGAADDTGRATLAEWAERLVEEAEPVVVVEMGSLDELTVPAASAVSRGLREAQRLDKGVRLVRCRRADFDRLRDAGLRGEVWHSGSLSHATEGALGGVDAVTRLHVRASSTALHRLEVTLQALARQLGLAPGRSETLRGAVLEATADALRHGSTQADDSLTLIFHRHVGQLVIEIQEIGPGCAPSSAATEVSLMRRLMDEVEFLPNPNGLLTRLTLRLPTVGELT